MSEDEKVYLINDKPGFRDWNTGKVIPNSDDFEGVFTLYGTGASGLMRTWLENGERAYASARKEVDHVGS